VRTLSSLLRRKVVTESGVPLGRCHDLRGELTNSKLRVTGLCVGRGGLLERAGIRGHDTHATIPWSAVARIDGKQIVVRDDALQR
jgi:sporulation protein YlmC with PRC-barrel domain